MGPFCRSKKFQKTEKKPCQCADSSIMPSANLTKPMEKPMTRNVLNRWGFIRVAFAALVGLPLIIATSAYAQNPGSPPTGPDQGAQAAAGAGTQAGQAAGPGAQAEAERVIVTGSNIPTAEEVGPNPVLSLNRDLINKAGEQNTE